MEKILLIHPDYCDSIKIFLKENDYFIYHAKCPYEAQRYLDENAYDLILISQAMAISREDVAIGYTEKETNGGSESGLAFFRKNLYHMQEMKAKVIVCVQDLNNEDVRTEFIESGLFRENFLSMMDFVATRTDTFHKILSIMKNAKNFQEITAKAPSDSEILKRQQYFDKVDDAQSKKDKKNSALQISCNDKDEDGKMIILPLITSITTGCSD